MAFKMKRPLKMAGPKPSVLKLGRASKNIKGDEGGVMKVELVKDGQD